MSDRRLALALSGGRARQLTSGSLTIGRSHTADLSFSQDALLSRVHAKIVGSGELWLHDLGSTNGTFLNSERIEAPTSLRKGDRIQVGSQVIEVVEQLVATPRFGARAGFDPYAVLGVDPTGTQEEIQANYRRLTLIYHPDRNQGPQEEIAAKKMKDVNEAFATLKDPASRSRYDRSRCEPDANRDEEIAQAALDAAMPLFELLRSSKDSLLDALSGRMEETRKAAVRQFESVESRWPDTDAAALALINLTWVHLWTGNGDAAKGAASRLRRHGDDAATTALVLTAHAHVVSGESRSALEILDRLLEAVLPPFLHVDALYLKGQILEKEDPAGALVPYLRLVQRYPHDDRATQALYRIARIVDSDLHDYRKAIALYGDVMACYPRSPEAADCQWRIDYLVAQHVSR